MKVGCVGVDNPKRLTSRGVNYEAAEGGFRSTWSHRLTHISPGEVYTARLVIFFPIAPRRAMIIYA